MQTSQTAPAITERHERHAQNDGERHCHGPRLLAGKSPFIVERPRRPARSRAAMPIRELYLRRRASPPMYEQLCHKRHLFLNPWTKVLARPNGCCLVRIIEKICKGTGQKLVDICADNDIFLALLASESSDYGKGPARMLASCLHCHIFTSKFMFRVCLILSVTGFHDICWFLRTHFLTVSELYFRGYTTEVAARAAEATLETWLWTDNLPTARTPRAHKDNMLPSTQRPSKSKCSER